MLGVSRSAPFTHSHTHNPSEFDEDRISKTLGSTFAKETGIRTQDQDM